VKLALALLAAAFSFAAAAAHARDDRFESMDANRDGRVSYAEFASVAGQAPKFRQLDPQQRAKRLQRRFHRLDEGKKGYLTREDFIAARDARRQKTL